jgi:hypothetical protein
MRDWVKRNMYDIAAVLSVIAPLLIVCVGRFAVHAQRAAGRPCPTGYSCAEYVNYATGEVTPLGQAKNGPAQKPAEQPTPRLEGLRGYAERDPILGVKELPQWIEQHCIAVLSPAHDIDHSKDIEVSPVEPAGRITSQGIEHISEVTLKLRCRPDATEENK